MRIRCGTILAAALVALAVGKSANKTPKTGDTAVLTLPGGEKMVLPGL